MFNFKRFAMAFIGVLALCSIERHLALDRHAERGTSSFAIIQFFSTTVTFSFKRPLKLYGYDGSIKSNSMLETSSQAS